MHGALEAALTRSFGDDLGTGDAAFAEAYCPPFDLHLLFRDRSRTSLPIVNGLYMGILGRLPDESGRIQWTAFLDAGSSTSWMGFELLASPEGRGQSGQRQETASMILRRAEILERLPILRQAGVLSFLAAPIRLEVVAAYLVALRRCPSSEELDAILAQLDAGQSVADLLVAMADSPEAHAGSRRRMPSRVWRALRRPSLVAEWSVCLAGLRADLALVASDPDAFVVRAG